MIYTVGHKESYDRYIPCRKKGRTQNYEGGSVWETYEQAARHAPSGFTVYGVQADWEKDTAPNKIGDWHDLLRSAEVVKLE